MSNPPTQASTQASTNQSPDPTSQILRLIKQTSINFSKIHCTRQTYNLPDDFGIDFAISHPEVFDLNNVITSRLGGKNITPDGRIIYLAYISFTLGERCIYMYLEPTGENKRLIESLKYEVLIKLIRTQYFLTLKYQALLSKPKDDQELQRCIDTTTRELTYREIWGPHSRRMSNLYEECGGITDTFITRAINEIINPTLETQILLVARGRRKRTKHNTRTRGNKSRGNKTRGNKTRGNKTRGNKSRGDKPKGNKTRGDKPKGNKTRGDKPKGNKTRGDKPKGNKTRGNI
jgi:hypothetical protein